MFMLLVSATAWCWPHDDGSTINYFFRKTTRFLLTAHAREKKIRDSSCWERWYPLLGRRGNGPGRWPASGRPGALPCVQEEVQHS